MPNDEFYNILGAIHQRPIEGEKPRKGVRMEEQADLIRAVRSATLLLADGQWYRRSKIMTLCKAHHVSYITIAKACELAESEGGSYVCIPNNNTPKIAPDEK